MTWGSDGERQGRKHRQSAGIWGSPEFLFGVTGGAYRAHVPQDRPTFRVTADALPMETPEENPQRQALLARCLFGWSRWLASLQRQDMDAVPAPSPVLAVQLSASSRRSK